MRRHGVSETPMAPSAAGGSAALRLPGGATFPPLALDLGSVLSDPCLVRPLSVKALLDAAVADDEVARALEAKGNPAILAMKAVSEERGARRESAAAVLAVLASRGLEVTPRVRTAVESSEDVAQLRRWLARAVTAASADDVIDEA
jgi:hypothetical protein